MANLVIKPASGSGNKLVFQNQAGAVDAVTVEDSGAIALGTVTAGSIAGGNISSATTFPAGHILQVKNVVAENLYTGVSSTTAKIMNVGLTTIGANSDFLIQCNVTHGVENVDRDVGCAVGYKTGSTSSTATDYLAVHGTNAQEVIGNMGSWYAQDTIGGATDGSWSGAYFIKEQSFQIRKDLSIASGTALDFSLWVAAANGNIVFGTSKNTSPNNTGSGMYLTIFEIAV